MDYALELAGLIIERRAAMGIRSQVALADLVGVSEATVRRWEHGTHLPDAWEVRRLADTLRVSPDQMLYPPPLTPREREVFRRAARTVGRALAARGEPVRTARPPASAATPDMTAESEALYRSLRPGPGPERRSASSGRRRHDHRPG